jgi:hypothetical protein
MTTERSRTRTSYLESKAAPLSVLCVVSSEYACQAHSRKRCRGPGPSPQARVLPESPSVPGPAAARVAVPHPVSVDVTALKSSVVLFASFIAYPPPANWEAWWRMPLRVATAADTAFGGSTLRQCFEGKLRPGLPAFGHSHRAQIPAPTDLARAPPKSTNRGFCSRPGTVVAECTGRVRMTHRRTIDRPRSAAARQFGTGPRTSTAQHPFP